MDEERTAAACAGIGADERRMERECGKVGCVPSMRNRLDTSSVAQRLDGKAV
jgi:hypothetical protein